jgi:hypothetical protein
MERRVSQALSAAVYGDWWDPQYGFQSNPVCIHSLRPLSLDGHISKSQHFLTSLFHLKPHLTQTPAQELHR